MFVICLLILIVICKNLDRTKNDNTILVKIKLKFYIKLKISELVTQSNVVLSSQICTLSTIEMQYSEKY